MQELQLLHIPWAAGSLFLNIFQAYQNDQHQVFQCKSHSSIFLSVFGNTPLIVDETQGTHVRQLLPKFCNVVLILQMKQPVDYFLLQFLCKNQNVIDIDF